MDYSVFILDLDEKVDTDDFIGNTDAKTAAVGMLASAAESLVGFDFYDKYTDKLTKEGSVGLTGSAVIDVKISTLIAKNTNYKIDVQLGDVNETGNWENVFSKVIKHTITVKGRLNPPDMLFAMGKGIAKKKDTSRIWQWANTPIDANGDKEYEKRYYRDLIVLTSSADQRRFRGCVYKKVFVENYEEYYDKNGEGTFTLVMVKFIKPDMNVHEFEFKGPDYKVTALSAAKDVAKAAKTAKDDLKTVSDASQKVLGKDNIVSEKLRFADQKVSGAEKIIDGANNVLDGGNLADQIGDQADEFRKNFQDQKDDPTVTDTKIETNADGSTTTTVTKTNPDGSQHITVTVKNKDGSTTVTESDKDQYGD